MERQLNTPQPGMARHSARKENPRKVSSIFFRSLRSGGQLPYCLWPKSWKRAQKAFLCLRILQINCSLRRHPLCVCVRGFDHNLSATFIILTVLCNTLQTVCILLSTWKYVILVIVLDGPEALRFKSLVGQNACWEMTVGKCHCGTSPKVMST